MGGHYPCGSCGAHIRRMYDFAYSITCKWRSLQELQCKTAHMGGTSYKSAKGGGIGHLSASAFLFSSMLKSDKQLCHAVLF